MARGQESLQSLYRNTVRVNHKGFPLYFLLRFPYKIIDIVIDDEMDFVLFTSYVVSEDSSKRYIASILFKDVEFLDKRTSSSVEVEDLKGNVYNIEPFKETQPVLIRCSCKFYYFYCSYYNMLYGCLYGPNFPRYKRLTTTYPEKNPNHLPCLCKHIFSLGKDIFASV